MSGKEITMINTVLLSTYLYSERYEVLNEYQGLYYMRSYKIMRI